MNKAQGMLGLCARAGGLVSGAQGVEGALKAGKAHLVLVDEAASELTRKTLRDMCAHRGIEMYIMEEQLLGDAIGRPGRMAAAITNDSFAGRICQLLKEGS